MTTKTKWMYTILLAQEGNTDSKKVPSALPRSPSDCGGMRNVFVFVGSSVSVIVTGTVCDPDGEGERVSVSVASCVGVPVGGGVLLPLTDVDRDDVVVLDTVMEGCSMEMDCVVVVLTVMVCEGLSVPVGVREPDGVNV